LLVVVVAVVGPGGFGALLVVVVRVDLGAVPVVVCATGLPCCGGFAVLVAVPGGRWPGGAIVAVTPDGGPVTVTPGRWMICGPGALGGRPAGAVVGWEPGAGSPPRAVAIPPGIVDVTGASAA
jgi:hypothetical protein